MAEPVEVLVVDDSAVVREMLTMILTAAGMRVTAAADPLFAMEKMKRRRPQVIVLDLEMPRMDGLTFLRRLMTEAPLPVVVCSALAGTGRETGLQALAAGAVEIVTKPRLGVRGFLEESAAAIVQAVEEASRARIAAAHLLPTPPPLVPDGAADGAADVVLALGASTGGTEALRCILEALPRDAPPLVAVQHMPAGFTTAFAASLDRTCRVTVREAEGGETLAPGLALIAPGGRHLLVRRRAGALRAELLDGPLESGHKPSVDTLFRSVVEAAGAWAVGVVLTGMGSDGAAGLLAMRQAGAATLAQDEASSVVFGMPKAAIERGAADEVVALEHMPAAMLGHARRARAQRAAAR
jgi:two-component system chemotaxis response regulator CheB